MKTVITYGTFDLFHIGHLRMLQRLATLGDKVVVGVSTDEFNLAKGKRAIVSFEQRIEIVKGLRVVDHAFPETCWEQKSADIQGYGADYLVMGVDWAGKFDHLSGLCEVVYWPRTPGISSSQIRTSLASIGVDSAVRERRMRRRS